LRNEQNMSEASLAREAFCHGSIRRERVEQIVAFEGSQLGAVMHTGRAMALGDVLQRVGKVFAMRELEIFCAEEALAQRRRSQHSSHSGFTSSA